MKLESPLELIPPHSPSHFFFGSSIAVAQSSPGTSSSEHRNQHHQHSSGLLSTSYLPIPHTPLFHHTFLLPLPSLVALVPYPCIMYVCYILLYLAKSIYIWHLTILIMWCVCVVTSCFAGRQEASSVCARASGHARLRCRGLAPLAEKSVTSCQRWFFNSCLVFN